MHSSAMIHFRRLKWHKFFCEGRKEVSNLTHARRPRSSITLQNISHVRDLIHDYRRITVRRICAATTISYGSVQTIIKKKLKLHKISARWVPRILNANHKAVRSEISQKLLDHFAAEGDSFLMRILTCDESWVYHYTPETKTSSICLLYTSRCV